MVATRTRRMTEAEYREFALGDGGGRWELHRGELVEKPPTTAGHGGVIDHVLAFLSTQLDRNQYRVRSTHARLRRSTDTYDVSDIAVIPVTAVQALFAEPLSLDAYPEALPLVIEVWSPSTGRYDIRDNLPDYHVRGDREIWCIHPNNRTLTAWRRRPDGTYLETIYRTGTIHSESLPALRFELEALF